MNDNAQILAIGDVHLGTACSGLPEAMSSWGINPGNLTPATALRLTVDFAIDKQVDAVLFAGDVVESTNARFEAMRPLEESVRRLLKRGVEVIAVAGNHDVEALPRLAALIEGFTLLGAGGRWEAITLSKEGVSFAQVVGWSFPEKYVRQSPVALLLDKPLPESSRSVPTIGLLHADLGASGGSYAPVRQAELDDTGYDAWLLGHIHKPSLEGLSASKGAGPSGYLGSLVALDPTETGPHGPWLLTVSNEGGIDLEQVPLAPLRWERITVPVDGISHVEDLPDRLLDAAQKHLRALSQAGPAPRVLGLQAQLTGTSEVYSDIRRRLEAGDWQSLVRRVDDTDVFFNSIEDAMESHLDLEKIASGDDPAALMAQRLLLLEQDDERSTELLGRARERLVEAAREDVWRPVQMHRSATNPLSDSALRDILLSAGRVALTEMLSSVELGD